MSHLMLCTLSLNEANAFVTNLHRHHKKVVGHKFSIGAFQRIENSENAVMVGACIVGRPVARALDNGLRLEVTRLCTDGTRNACSFLYSAAARAAWALGYDEIVTYVLDSENGTSLKASGWSFVHVVKGRSWTCPSRPRIDKHPTVDKRMYRMVNPQ